MLFPTSVCFAQSLAEVSYELRLSNLNQSFLLRTFSASRKRCSEVNLPEYHEGRLEGTVGEHQCYILLHTPHSPESFPSVYKTALQLELQARATKWGGLVNFSWFEGLAPAQNVQPATVFSRLGGKLDIPDIKLENIDEVERLIRQHLEGPVTKSTSEDVHIYVCTHGARDCRCGDRGVQVYNALLEAVRAQRTANPTGAAHRIKVGEVGHVGGHKYAANVLLYPQGEWLGTVKPEDAPAIISEACAALEKGVSPLAATDPPLFISQWRGRMGLSKQAQKELWMKASGHELPKTSEANWKLRPVART